MLSANRRRKRLLPRGVEGFLSISDHYFPQKKQAYTCESWECGWTLGKGPAGPRSPLGETTSWQNCRFSIGTRSCCNWNVAAEKWVVVMICWCKSFLVWEPLSLNHSLITVWYCFITTPLGVSIVGDINPYRLDSDNCRLESPQYITIIVLI